MTNLMWLVTVATLQRQKKRKTIEEAPAKVPEPSEFRCLVRATDGKKKISCSVSSYPSFFRIKVDRFQPNTIKMWTPNLSGVWIGVDLRTDT